MRGWINMAIAASAFFMGMAAGNGELSKMFVLIVCSMLISAAKYLGDKQ